MVCYYRTHTHTRHCWWYFILTAFTTTITITKNLANDDVSFHFESFLWYPMQSGGRNEYISKTFGGNSLNLTVPENLFATTPRLIAKSFVFDVCPITLCSVFRYSAFDLLILSISAFLKTGKWIQSWQIRRGVRRVDRISSDEYLTTTASSECICKWKVCCRMLEVIYAGRKLLWKS